MTNGSCVHWSALLRGDPECVSGAALPKKGRPAVVKISVDIAIEQFGDAAHIWSARFSRNARQAYPRSDLAAFPPRASVAGCDHRPERPLDCSAIDRSLRLATRATIYRSRSGLRLWRCRHPAASSNGYTGSADLATVAVAKRVFGETDRFD